MMMSGLSGNEIYCLAQKGWTPGNIVVGNSVYSLGFLGSLASSLRTLAGGEIANVTELISEGRHAAIRRLEEEANQEGAHGLTGVVSELKTVSGLTEFLAIGSAIRGQEYRGPFFTTACSGQDLFCQIDAGYDPRHFVIGNVAYALGVTRGLMGTFKQEARDRGANAVVDIITRVLPFGPGVREMLMVGTASHNPVLGETKDPVTSELTGEELWN